MRDARNDRPGTLASGSSSAPSNGTSAGTTTLRLVFREFPILGPESTLTARAVLASRAQGLYEPFHWAPLGADGPFDLDHISGGARSVGLDAERLACDMEDPSPDALIERNAILANVLGVRGPPEALTDDRAPCLHQQTAIPSPGTHGSGKILAPSAVNSSWATPALR